ncbi:MAG: hydrogenase small subunit [Sulfuricaulis sp.]|uniref:hydrogenase small subunit n=1 Tax=Sulfuricaulis sp. TaxID=2003553 RepID=UPI0025F1FFE9|nr:hydrogenase small subunit [Sulfuricaulis sp.]MCR4347104.1 hydrogenase small subunit [Sulfuricaulis sp.]
MPDNMTLGEKLVQQGISRRTFLKFCASMASLMALPPSMAAEMAEKLAKLRRQSVIWLSFQECTGCTESITRSHSPTIESLIFDAISLDYHHTLMAASGTAAEHAREQAMKENAGKYLLVVDGSVPAKDTEYYSTIAGISNYDMLVDTAKGAMAILSVGTCAAYGGIPKANPNPTGAVAVSDIIKDKPIINIPGCPPIATVMTGVIAHVLTLGTIPDLDELGRPKVFFGDTIHDRCYRRPFYDQGKFAKSFDDEGARNGWCLYELGCKGPTTYNSCATTKWNGGVSFPIESGHGCLGCSEPDFWDKGSFYKPLSTGEWGGGQILAAGVAAGAVIGVGAAFAARKRQDKASGGK